MSDPIVIPGGRDVRGRLDGDGGTGAEPTPGDGGTGAEPTPGDGGTGAEPTPVDSVVVACPPHPQHGGSRSDPRLRAVSDALAPDVACLRFDYGPWDEGEGETVDARNALSWAGNRFERVGLFGYSFGAGVALRAATQATCPAACAVLAPPGDAAAAVDGIDCPLQVVVGERDDTVDWVPVADRARELGCAVDAFPAGHGFQGELDRVSSLVADFFGRRL